MAINPYGLSYGIGQMLGGVPDAYYQGQQQAVQQKAQETSQQVNDLKLADLQRKEQERVALESEMSKDMPSDLVPDNADPKEKMAAVYAWRANNLRNTGYGSLAEPLDKQSMALHQDVLAEHGKMAAKQLMFGDYASALDVLKNDKILSPDATAKNDPDNDDNILITTHGQTLSVSRLDVAAMASGEKNIFQVASKAQTEAKKEEGRSERDVSKYEFKNKELEAKISKWKTDDSTRRFLGQMHEAGLAAGRAMSHQDRQLSGSVQSILLRGILPTVDNDYVAAGNILTGIYANAKRNSMAQPTAEGFTSKMVEGLAKGGMFPTKPEKQQQVVDNLRSIGNQLYPSAPRQTTPYPVAGSKTGTPTPSVTGVPPGVNPALWKLTHP